MSDVDAVIALDDDARDALLASLLTDHPGALVAALDGFGRMVDVPASVQLTGQLHVDSSSRSPFDLMETGSRMAMIEMWERARAVGAASTPVLLVTGADASLHVVDVRGRHGVIVGMLTAAPHVELREVLAERPVVAPRTGRIEKDELSVIRAADESLCQILGYPVADLIGTRSLDLVHPDEQERAVDAWMDLLSAPDRTTRLRARHRRGDGSWLWMELTNTNRLEHAEGRVICEMIDITDEMDALEALRGREQLLRRLAEALPSGVFHIDRDRNVVYVNARLRRVVGVEDAETVDEQLATVIADDRPALEAAIDRALTDGRDTDLEVRLRIPDTGLLHLCAIAIRALTDALDAPDGAVLCIDDVTEAAELRAELERRATVDHLTGCLNRATVLQELDRVLRRHAAGSPGTAVVYLDLDDFKAVNDTHGHTAGDQLLVSVVNRLTGVLRIGDNIGRLGGDEFIVVLPLIDGLDEAMTVGQRLEDALSEPPEIVGGRPMHIRASVGVAWSPAADISADALTAAADHAMYASKRRGDSQAVYVVV